MNPRNVKGTMEKQEKKMREVPISPEIWERIGPLHDKMNEHKPRMKELFDQMSEIKKEMKMLLAVTGYTKSVFFKALQKEMPDLGMKSYGIETDPPRIVEEEKDPDLKGVIEIAKLVGLDIGDLLG